jgi:hypothetical protein
MRGATGSHEQGALPVAEIFGGSGIRTRTAIGVQSLSDGAPVELMASLSA